MSSDGSSGITQFGLYRTIDARTEEFLRSSRKRQIRQGCACAAISTAITVTVVVSVLLVCEYSIISGSNMNKGYVTKSNWLGFINDSADTTPFDAKYSKAKLTLDKTTIKLHPILLKMLKQNIIFKNAIEDYTSASPIYEPSDTTEQNYEKNIFSDPKNWFKAPSSRLYAIEFKTSPIAYYQPTRNLEYLTKIRKIRDYKRILNYFEKIINDKVTSGSNLGMMKKELQFENLSELSTMPIRNLYKSKEKNRIGDFNKNVERPPVIDTKNCKCPIPLRDLLKKLMGNISQLLPYSNMAPTLCNTRKSTKLITFPPKVTKDDLLTKFTTLKPINVITTPNCREKNKITTENSHLIIENNTTKESIENYIHSNKTNLLLEKNVNKKLNIEMETTENHIDKYEKQTTVKNYLEATESKNIKPHTTKSMTSITEKFANMIYQNFQDDFTSTKSTVATNKIDNKSILSNEDYDDYFISTSRTRTDDAIDIQNLELIKTRIISPNNNVKSFKNKNDVKKNAFETQSDITSPSLVPIKKCKQKDVSSENRKSSIFLQKLINSNPKTIAQKDRIKLPKIEKATEFYKFNNIIHSDNQFVYDDKMLEDEFFEEYKIKQSKTTDDLNNQKELTLKPTDIVNFHNIKDYAKNNEHLPKRVNSMLPQARPVYLEIQRNDWEQDDTHDYEFNMNNNLYDFPNI